MTDRPYATGDLVRSEQFGVGTVRFDGGPSIIVRFAHGIEECERTSLTSVSTPMQAIERQEWDSPAEVIARIQAEAITSTNDTWGVFSRSRIELLPHQLWVCRRVLERWPARWLVADDVGLGKTIEAGLILWPLLSRGTVRRLLILCPASLVDQWQWRLREMFDIRLARYLPELDTAKSDFWNSQTHVVASLHTLRLDRSGRLSRLIESDPWDLVLVDEAHHLNADEERGPTLGYRLVDRLVEHGRVQSMVFFTGTPHRGKDFGFWSLMRLLRPDLFDPKKSPREQLPRLSQAVIRNNKQNVTDLRGRRLFQEPIVRTETYAYSEAESRFYEVLTAFILRGEAYASSLTGANGRAVVLVLIAMQKLASSSVAAIRRALRRRLEGLQKARASVAPRDRAAKSISGQLSDLTQYGSIADDDFDQASRIEEEVLGDTIGLRLMLDEEQRLRDLIALADAVSEETKIAKIMTILRTISSTRPVLFFTEYKATQSLLMSALIREFGDTCMTFINGDERADEVIDSQGVMRTVTERRERAAELFNSGAVRFLVSTEAGGEGIDLQECCHSLVHVDLPWNPMRMHQRVGRLNRYGQRERVEVISLRNPDTVESLIWEKLNQKIESIMRALGTVMDEPEDLLQLVLGMTSPSLFRELYSEAHRIPREALADWFDGKTAQFAGKDAVDTVKELVGYAAKFEYQQVSDRLPRVDLPALRPFFRLMIAQNGRQIREEEGSLSFRTPDLWLDDSGVRPTYEGLIFDRSVRSREAAPGIVGVGHRAFDRAIRQAKDWDASATTVPADAMSHPLVAFTVVDQVTTEATTIRSVMVGVELIDRSSVRILSDWELLDRLNVVLGLRGPRRLRVSEAPPDRDLVRSGIQQAHAAVEEALPSLDLPFKLPLISILAVMWPASSTLETEPTLTELGR